MQNMPTISQKGNSKPPTPAQANATKILQKFLNIAVDGNFGPGTHEAVVRYQKAHGLDPDGVVGAKTWATIPDPKQGQAATPVQQTIATQNAAATAATQLKQVAGRTPTPKPQPTGPATSINIPVPRPVAAVASAASNAGKAVGRQVQSIVPKSVQVVYKKQSLAMRIVTAAALTLGSIAGVKALWPDKRKA